MRRSIGCFLLSWATHSVSALRSVFVADTRCHQYSRKRGAVTEGERVSHRIPVFLWDARVTKRHSGPHGRDSAESDCIDDDFAFLACEACRRSSRRLDGDVQTSEDSGSANRRRGHEVTQQDERFCPGDSGKRQGRTIPLTGRPDLGGGIHQGATSRLVDVGQLQNPCRR